MTASASQYLILQFKKYFNKFDYKKISIYILSFLD